MQYILLAIAFLAIAVYLNHREAKEEARRHEYDRLRNTRPPDKKMTARPRRASQCENRSGKLNLYSL